MVEANLLGRKTGRGHYDYTDGGVTGPEAKIPAVAQKIVDRIVTMLINEAADALFWRVASRDDIDLAMTLGVNYPKGLLRWGDEIGEDVVFERMRHLQTEYGEDRYRPSPLLRRMSSGGERFYP